jgi:two-component system chemotaxis sensor kinase CheA
MLIEDAELIKEFVVESQEHLANVESQLLSLEAQGDQIDTGLVNTVFRAVHSIKGTAGFMGLETIGSLAHREEEVLNRLRGGDLRPTSEVINTLLKATDQLKTLLDGIETSNEVDISENLAALERILQGEAASNSTAPAASAIAVSTDEPIVRAADKTANSSAGESVSAEALREFLVESYENLEQLERDLMTLERDPTAEPALRSVFRTIHTIKGTAGFLGYSRLERVTHVGENLLGSLRSGQIVLNTEVGSGLFALVDAIRKTLAVIESTGSEGDSDHAQLADRLVHLQEAKLAAPKGAEVGSRQKAAGSEQNAGAGRKAVNPNPAGTMPSTPQPLTPSTSRPSQAPADSHTTSAADSTIRVDVALLDKLMTRVGELVLARNQILQFTSSLGDASLLGTSQRLNLITTELQEGVMKTRMQQIGNVWSKFPRLVRDLATTCGKQVRIEMEGKETELDKTIIEAIKDPLTHLVRNTVDHGIESPPARVTAGKAPEGCLTLRAFHEGGQVNIEISDDGTGLNLERIKQKAVERGIVAAEQAARMVDREIAQLIFLPGFSTAEKVSNVSGRGVGMDVVKTNIEKIGGTVDVQTQSGKGTSIKIKIPLTLAIIPALIVTSDGDRYAIPQVNLLELVRLEGEQAERGIEWIQGAPVYRLRGRLLPLVYLRRELQIDETNVASDIINIVVLRADDRQFGLVVDRINDTEEIVVKPLSKQLKGVSVYSGTTIMGDGKVALILDVLGLAHSAHVVSETRDRAMHDSHGRGQDHTSVCQTLLVLGVGENRRLALPISQVARLEKISPQMIELADHQEVVQYRGEILPLIRLAEVLDVEALPLADDAMLQVVVYSEKGRSVGLIVDRIVDIVEATLDVTRKAKRDGLLSSAVIHEHVTDLLDLPAIIRQADPVFFEEQAAV